MDGDGRSGDYRSEAQKAADGEVSYKAKLRAGADALLKANGSDMTLAECERFSQVTADWALSLSEAVLTSAGIRPT